MNKFRLWLCKYLGRHRHYVTGFDGCSFHGKCHDCGYEGLIDSTDTLF